jgi:hypothetical protein
MKNQISFNLEAICWQKAGQILALALFIILGDLQMVHAQEASHSSAQITEVEACIHTFAKAADKRDLKTLEVILHPAYRSVLNKAFGSPDVSLLSKEDYIGMAKAEKIGGTDRQLHILALEMQPEIAHATVLMESADLRFTSYLSMVRNAEGKWQVISDTPRIEALVN